MLRLVSAVALGLTLATSWLAPATQGAEAVRHTGTIVSVASDHRALTLEGLGPSTGPIPRPVRRSIALTPETTVVAVTRSQAAPPGGWPGGFRESALTLSDLRPGDYVTISAEAGPRGLVAREVAVIRPTPEAP